MMAGAESGEVIAMRLRVLAPALVAMGLLAAALPAGATHDGTLHSRNMRLLANGPVHGSTVSDVALWGRTAFLGDYRGFTIWDVSDPEAPEQLVDVACNGQQHDVTVWRDLMFLSVDRPITEPPCGPNTASGVPGFEGILIYDVGTPSAPAFVKAVATDCGSHTHTLIPDGNRVLLYVSSYPASFFGPTPFGTNCQRLDENGEPLGHSKISVVEVPLSDPESASVIAEPHIPLSDFRGIPGYRGCHDIGVFLEPGLAAAACLEEGQIWDISDPLSPEVLHRVDEPDVDIYHSGAFSYDAEVAVFGDEFGGGFGSGCPDPSSKVGRAWFHDVDTGATLGSFMIPRPQGSEICTIHNYNVMPVGGRDILVSAWNLGGTSVIDFTDPTNAREIGYVDVQESFGGRGPWSSYWYNGFIYVSDRGRGLDVLLLSDRIRALAKRFPYLNAQTQEALIG
jgi:hypothetical protein